MIRLVIGVISFVSSVLLLLVLAYAAPADAAEGQRARFTSNARSADVTIYPTWQSRYRLVFVGSCRGFASRPRVDIFITEDKFESEYQARVTSDWSDADEASEAYCISD